MAYLDYYRSNPQWATQQWQSIAPPAPSFQPQPSWGGQDFYRAMAGSGYDSGIYNYVYNRLQGIGSQGLASMGPSLIEAKIQHRRAYGGLGDILTMAPTEIGAAAAYEVWRNWRHNYGTLAQPLSGDSMRQQEALVGLAIGEATKLWQYTTRVADNAGRLAAVEAAAIAAARIFDQGNELLLRGGGGGYGGGMGMGMGVLSPAIPGGAMGGMGMGAGMGSMAGSIASPSPVAVGMGMGAGGLAVPSLLRQRSLSVGAEVAPYGGYGMGDGGYGMGAGVGAGMGVPSYAGSATSMGMGAGMGGAGMYNTANGFLAPGAGVGIQRPLSASAGGIPYASSAPSSYDVGADELAETALARHERHRAERAAARAERAALKEARYRDRLRDRDAYYGPRAGRAYDDNYEYEYGRGGYGSDYDNGYAGAGSAYGDGYTGSAYGDGDGLYRRSRRRRASMYGDGHSYGYGGGRYGAT